VRQVRSAAVLAGPCSPRLRPFGHGGPFGDRLLGSRFPGRCGLWDTVRQVRSTAEAAGRAWLGLCPFGHDGPFGDRLLGSRFPGRCGLRDTMSRTPCTGIRCLGSGPLRPRRRAEPDSAAPRYGAGDRDRCTTKHVALGPPPWRPRRRFGRLGPLQRANDALDLARVCPVGHVVPVGGRPLGRSLPGPMWPLGHDEPDPLHSVLQCAGPCRRCPLGRADPILASPGGVARTCPVYPMRRSEPGPFHPLGWSGPARSVPWSVGDRAFRTRFGYFGFCPGAQKVLGTEPFTPVGVFGAPSLAPDWSAGDRTLHTCWGVRGSFPGTPKSAGIEPFVPVGTSGSVTCAPRSAGDRAFLTRLGTRGSLAVVPAERWGPNPSHLLGAWGSLPGAPGALELGPFVLARVVQALSLAPRWALGRTGRTRVGGPCSDPRTPRWVGANPPPPLRFGEAVPPRADVSGRAPHTREGVLAPGRSRPVGHVGLGPVRPEGRGELSRRPPKERSTRGRKSSTRGGPHRPRPKTIPKDRRKADRFLCGFLRVVVRGRTGPRSPKRAIRDPSHEHFRCGRSTAKAADCPGTADGAEPTITTPFGAGI
jgi:hypothetical protein